MFISVTIAEIQTGIERIRLQDNKKAVEIEAWLVRMIQASQILPMNAEVAREWARMMHRQPQSLAEDAWIAATAKHHGLTVATRNLKDFEGLDVPLLNPFEDRR